MLFAFFPDVFSGLRVKRIDLNAVALIIIGLGRAALGLYEKALFHHGIEIFALSVNRRPYRNDDLYAHRVKLIDHSLRIRPVGLVKLPVALHGPMEKVDDDLVDLDALFLVFTGNREHFILCAVAELALPESHEALREHGSMPCHRGVVCEYSLGIGICRDPVVHLLCCSCDPLCIVVSEGHTADCRVVPQETIAEGRDHERHGGLGITLRELKRAALHVHAVLLVLAHSEYLFTLVCLKTKVEAVVTTADDTLPFAVHRL